MKIRFPDLLSVEDLARMTSELGEGWGAPHCARLLRLIGLIGAGLAYDAEALTAAVYLHDWGAFPAFRQPGVNHVTRSREVVECEVLPRLGWSADRRARVLEAVEKHDYRDPRPIVSIEAVLLREADMLDLIGAIGMAREFAWGPNDLAVCLTRILSRREAMQGLFTLPEAARMAEARFAHMDACLSWLRDEGLELPTIGKG